MISAVDYVQVSIVVVMLSQMNFLTILGALLYFCTGSQLLGFVETRAKTKNRVFIYLKL